MAVSNLEKGVAFAVAVACATGLGCGENSRKKRPPYAGGTPGIMNDSGPASDLAMAAADGGASSDMGTSGPSDLRPSFDMATDTRSGDFGPADTGIRSDLTSFDGGLDARMFDMTPDSPPSIDMPPDVPPSMDLGPDLPPPVDMPPDLPSPVDMNNGTGIACPYTDLAPFNGPCDPVDNTGCPPGDACVVVTQIIGSQVVLSSGCRDATDRTLMVGEACVNVMPQRCAPTLQCITFDDSCHRLCFNDTAYGCEPNEFCRRPSPSWGGLGFCDVDCNL